MSGAAPAFDRAKHHPLTRWRFEFGLTIEQVADMLDCTRGYLSEIENRKKEPSLAFAAKVVKLTAGSELSVEFKDLVIA